MQEQSSFAAYLGAAPSKWPADISVSSTPVTTGQAEGTWLQWTSDGKLLMEDNDFHAYRMNPDGSSRARVPDRETSAAMPIGCGNDALVYAALQNNNLNLLPYATATGDIKQLPFEKDTEWPVCTRDGKSVYYVDNLEEPALKRVATTGGAAEVVAANTALGASFSPDEKRIAFLHF